MLCCHFTAPETEIRMRIALLRIALLKIALLKSPIISPSRPILMCFAISSYSINSSWSVVKSVPSSKPKCWLRPSSYY